MIPRFAFLPSTQALPHEALVRNPAYAGCDQYNVDKAVAADPA